MIAGTREHAALANDAYSDRSKDIGGDKFVFIDEVRYRILATADRSSGYQGTAYERLDTGAVVIAHRGTESVKDGITDASMVVVGRNNQLDDAMAFTQRVVEEARKWAELKHQPLNVTVTGHSLGGTLAEITAAKYGLPAETFNAYGPTSLKDLRDHDVDVNGRYPHIVNHVRATDVVGAGSPHFGEVRTYATPQDIESLKRGRYLETGLLHLPTNPFLTADLSAHKMSNFLPNNDATGSSIINADNEARARTYHGAIEHFHKDVVRNRIDLTMVVNRAPSPLHALNPLDPAVKLKLQAIDAGMTMTGQIVANQVTQGVRVAERTGQQTAQLVSDGAARAYEALTRPGSWFDKKTATNPASATRLDQPDHPDHALFKQAQGGVHLMDAKVGRTPDERSDNLAAALVVAARSDSLKRIDHVVLSTDNSKVFAVQGALDSALKKIASVPTVDALDTPVAQSTRILDQAIQQKAVEQQAQRQRQDPMPSQLQQRSGATMAI